MTLRPVPDDEDDSMAANPESPRDALGYAATTAPRLTRRPTGGETHWRFVEATGPAAASGAIGGAKVCAPKPKGCGEPSATLHADPRSTHPERTICPACTGAIMRERIGWAKASDPSEPDRRRP